MTPCRPCGVRRDSQPSDEAQGFEATAHIFFRDKTVPSVPAQSGVIYHDSSRMGPHGHL